MKFLFVTLLTISFSQYCCAQDTMFVANGGTRLKDVVPAKYLYQYPQFLRGKVCYRDETVSEGLMNYNMSVDEIHFIGERGDTLALSDEATIKFVCIDKDTFCFDHGFMMLIAGNDEVKLAAKRGLKIIDMKSKEAGYDGKSRTTSAATFSSFDDGIISHDLVVGGQLQLSGATRYYFGNKYGHFVLATKSNCLELFHSCAASLKRFISKNNVDFAKRNDLERVIMFLKENCRITHD